MRIAVLGARGMAGHVMARYLRSRGHFVAGLCRGARNPDIEFDAFRPERLEPLLRRIKPGCVINCIGALIHQSESDPASAIYLNSYFPHYLERLLSGTRMRIIHLSTDCVFSGERGGYRERDVKDGTGFYAQSKALGEIDNGKDLTIRTSIIGPELKSGGAGLFHWLMRRRGLVSGYAGAYWTGLTTLELATAVEKLMHPGISGICHLVPDSKISKYELLRLISDTWGLDVKIRKASGHASDKSLISTRRDLKLEFPGYADMLLKLRRWMDDNKALYAQYYR